MEILNSYQQKVWAVSGIIPIAMQELEKLLRTFVAYIVDTIQLTPGSKK